jgi:ABC-type Fe3+ transport system permease subunit
VAVIAALNRPSDSPFAWLTVCYDRTLLAPILVQTIRSLPWTAAVVWALWRRVPDELLDAARCDGMGYWRQLWQIALPQQARGVAIAGGLAFAIAAGELSGTLLTLPPGVTPITVRLFGLLHYGMDERAAALCLSMCGGAVLWGVCGWALSGQAARGGEQASR